MTDNPAVRTALELLRAEREKAVAKVAVLDAGIAALESLDPASPAPSVATNGARTATPPAFDPRLSKKLTMRELAAIALEDSQAPMRAREIFEHLTARGFKYPRGFDVFKGSLVPTLSRDPLFAKFETGLYGLASWQNQTAPNA